MGAEEFGAWRGLDVSAVGALFGAAPFRWWIAGGRALELYAGRSWRAHDDTDVGMLRPDVGGLRDVLAGWDIHVASGGVLRPWSGEGLDGARDENNVWCRPTPREPWALDVLVSDGDGAEWVYRRDDSVHLPWGDAVLVSRDGLPYLAPEVQLLYKSKGLRAKDDVDAREVIPMLDSQRVDRLRSLLSLDHPWQTLLAAGR